MRGRALFKIFKPLIQLWVGIFRLMPDACILVIWAMLDVFHGKLGTGLRYCILKAKAGHCGDCVYVGPNVEIRNVNKLYIGNNVSIHRFSYIDALGEIHIGDNVSVAHNCSFVSFNHTWADPSLPIRDNPTIAAPIVLENDIWLGCGVRVVAGVRIFSRTVVAAGAVVVKSTQPAGLYAGVPAKLIKKLL